jgi:hypothetical protein
MARWGECDFKQMKDLFERIEKIGGADIDKFIRDTSNEVAALLLGKVKKKTPVGVKPKLGPRTIRVAGVSGRKRTFLSKDGAILEKYWAGYVGGNLRRNWTTTIVTKSGSMYKIEVINETEYASFAEYGHRQTPGRYVPQLGRQLKRGWQPGKFMMTKSVAEVDARVPALIEKRLTKFLAEALNAK